MRNGAKQWASNACHIVNTGLPGGSAGITKQTAAERFSMNVTKQLWCDHCEEHYPVRVGRDQIAACPYCTKVTAER